MIDTHTHLFSEEFNGDIDAVIERAVSAGVTHMVCPAIDSQTHQRLFTLVRKHGDQCLPLIGLHPTSINDNPSWHEELALVEKYLVSPPENIRWYGIGEVGLDLYWSKDYLREQQEAFSKQIELALEYGLPLSIHVREAWNETKETLRRYADRGLKGVMHAFSGTIDDYEEVKRYGDFAFGIGGVITYKKSTLPDVVAKMDIGDIVLETDSPYLTPVPYRGKRNESSYLSYICAKIAEIKKVDAKIVAEATTRNAQRIFKIQQS